MADPADTVPEARWRQYHTERLCLRPLRAGDEADVLRLLSDERVVRWMLFPLFTPEHARSFVERTLAQHGADPPAALVLAMEPREGGAVLGLCGLVVNAQRETGEAWYLLDPELWGRGLTGEAVEALLEVAFRGLGLHRVWATCLPENPASARVLARAGFRREGYQKEALKIQGEWRDSYLYALLRHEWEERAQRAASAAA